MNSAWSFHWRAQPGGAPGWQWVRRDRASASVLASLKRFAQLMDCFDDASRHGFAGWARASLLTVRELPQRASRDVAPNPTRPHFPHAVARPLRGA